MSQPGDSNANAGLPPLTTAAAANHIANTGGQISSVQPAATQTIPSSANLSVSTAETAATATASVVDRPESPVNRKRSEVKDYDDDIAHGFGGIGGDDLRPSQDGKASAFPPLKKSKTSPPLLPGSLTGYRSPDHAKDDTTSPPQTSPVLDPLMPVTTVGISNNTAINRRRSPPGGVTATLARARTLEEVRSTPPPSFSRHATANLDAGNASIERLNLGTPSERPPTAERTMGVITSRPGSRQTSPDIVTVEMKSPGRPLGGGGDSHLSIAMTTTEEVVVVDEDEEDPDQTRDSHMSTPGDDFNTTTTSQVGNDINSSSSSSNAGSGSSHGGNSDDDGRPEKHILDTSLDYNEDDDADYESGIGEPKEDESESETDLANHSFDANELHVDSDTDTADYSELYIDQDPYNLDVYPEEEALALIEEAREHGIQHMMENYVFNDSVSLKKLFLAFDPHLEVNWNRVPVVDLQEAIPYVISRALRQRRRLENVHTIEKVVDLLKTSKNIMVLTGAGVSVSCGIPDFRSEDGIYSRLSEFQLDDPQQMFDLEFFKDRPEIFYSFAREIFPSNFTPSPSHYFIRLLEERGTLLRNYTQNIDTLEQKAGIKNVLQCHGSFATASCLRCGHQVDGNDIKDAIFKQEVAYCKVCTAAKQQEKKKKKKKSSKSRYHSSDDDDDDDDDEERPLMKPDIVFFGERLPRQFDDSLEIDKDKVDLLIVIGSSLKVAPVSDIMAQLPARVPQILINRTPIIHMNFDVQLLGNCDTIVAELCRRSGWELEHEKLPGGRASAGSRAECMVVEPNTYLFEGAVMHDVEYHDRLNKGRKRGRPEVDDHGDAEGNSGSSTDEESSRRRQFIHVWGNQSMDEDSEGEGESDSSTDTIQQGSAAAAAAAAATGLTIDPAAAVALAEAGGPGTSPMAAPVSAGSMHVPREGFAIGTTEPHSGNLEDIHQLQSPIMRSTSACSSSSSRHSDKEGGSGSGGDRGDEDEESARIRVMFTEKMPKDLGEEEPHLPSEDMSGYESSGSSHHDRRSSMAPSLGPISEDPAHEVDEDDGGDEGEDGHIGKGLGVMDGARDLHQPLGRVSQVPNSPSDSAMETEPAQPSAMLSPLFMTSVPTGVSQQQQQQQQQSSVSSHSAQPGGSSGFGFSLSQPVPASGSTTPFELLSPRLTASQPHAHRQQPSGFFSPPLSAARPESRSSPVPPNPSSFDGLGPPASSDK
ncbi:NAD-dependent histone deacetylase sir2 [Actinomortierella ambigua]|uniref:NAD-dependent histone deacetylase sir2 n=1 Tax=Actinomortierella ambigua TaxID=1343610 RepID=A0A9P6Q8V9_9FUNG|nr:NAD-dependent histone deacetylase sir2 [Actinomortierella ambigua]